VIDPAIWLPAEHQRCGGLTDALDAGPAVVRIGPLQIRQIDVHRVGVDVDEPGVRGPVSVDGAAPNVMRVGRYPRR
jgi:hypothetical protein